MNIITINELRASLKNKCFKMPNFSYCHRCGASWSGY